MHRFSILLLLAATASAADLTGNDLRDMSKSIHDILTNAEVIAIDQDKTGRQGRRVSRAGEQEIWVRPVEGGAHAVALFNRGAAEAGMTVKWEDVKLKPKHARDLWEHKDVSLQGDEYHTTVPSHGVVLLRVK